MGNSKDKEKHTIILFVLLFLLFLGLLAGFLVVTITYNNRLNEESSQINRLIEEGISQVDEFNDYKNQTNHEIADILEQLSVLSNTSNRIDALQDEFVNYRNITDEELARLNGLIQDQTESFDVLLGQFNILQSQFELFMEEYMQFVQNITNGTMGSGGGGGMMTMDPPSGSAFVNFNSTPFVVRVTDPLCCASLSSQRTDYYSFDYVNRGQVLAETQVINQTIWQNYNGLAIRQVSGITLEPGAYNIDFFLDVFSVVNGLASPVRPQFFLTWTRNTTWNTPFGFDFAQPGAPTNFANLVGVTNSFAYISVTNPTGTQSSYMTVNNFFISTGTETLFIMARLNPMGGNHQIQINSFSVHFNKM